jgi:hypothetical protein
MQASVKDTNVRAGEHTVSIDFTPVHNHEIRMLEFSQQVSVNDLRQMTNDLFAATRRIIESATDAQIVYEPIDPNADDPYAKAGEEALAWNLGHLVAHVRRRRGI